MAEPLKPCPFCGFPNENPGLRICADPEEYRDRSWWVECDNCLCQGPQAPTSEAAFNGWNRRAVPEETLRLVEAVRRYMDNAEHSLDCARSGFLRGRPTPDGGYECFYRTNDGLKWFRSLPVDETPKCDCGLDDVIAALPKEGE